MTGRKYIKYYFTSHMYIYIQYIFDQFDVDNPFKAYSIYQISIYNDNIYIRSGNLYKYIKSS